MKHLPLKNIIGLCIGLTLSACVLAKTTADGAWARATVPGQNMGGAFVNLTSDQDATLIGATSSVSEKVELHTMKMEGPAVEPIASAGKQRGLGYLIILNQRMGTQQGGNSFKTAPANHFLLAAGRG